MTHHPLADQRHRRRKGWWKKTRDFASDVAEESCGGCGSRRGDGCGDGCDGCGCDSPFLIAMFTLGFASLRAVPAEAAAPHGPLSGFLWRRVRAYQLYVSAHRPPCCPMTPTCSRYALDSLKRHGAFKGLLLTARRLRRCRPGRPHGYDPVPPAR